MYNVYTCTCTQYGHMYIVQGLFEPDDFTFLHTLVA